MPGGKSGAPPVPDGKGAPPVPDGKGAPPVPSVKGTSPAPPAKGGAPAPPGKGGAPAPPAKGGAPAPPAKGGAPAPPAKGAATAPPAKGGAPAPTPAQPSKTTKGATGKTTKGFGKSTVDPLQTKLIKVPDLPLDDKGKVSVTAKPLHWQKIARTEQFEKSIFSKLFNALDQNAAKPDGSSASSSSDHDPQLTPKRAGSPAVSPPSSVQRLRKKESAPGADSTPTKTTFDLTRALRKMRLDFGSVQEKFCQDKSLKAGGGPKDSDGPKKDEKLPPLELICCNRVRKRFPFLSGSMNYGGMEAGDGEEEAGRRGFHESWSRLLSGIFDFVTAQS